MLDTDTILKQILHSTILSLNGWSIYINCYKEINKQPSYWNKRFERTNVLLNRACLEWQLYPDTRNSRNILTKILILKIDPGSNILYWNVSQKTTSNVNGLGYCWKIIFKKHSILSEVTKASKTEYMYKLSVCVSL